jgi:hypothetical protein
VRRADETELPLLEIDFSLGQPCDFPRLAPAAVPIDPCIAERDKTQRKVAAVEPLRIPSNGDDWPVEIAAG